MLSNLKRYLWVFLPFTFTFSLTKDLGGNLEGNIVTTKAQSDLMVNELEAASSNPLETAKKAPNQKQDQEALAQESETDSDEKGKTEDEKKENKLSFNNILRNLFCKAPKKIFRKIYSEAKEFLEGPFTYLSKKFYKFIKKNIIESSYKGEGGFLWSEIFGIYKNEAQFKEAIKKSEENGNMIRTMLPMTMLVSLIKSIPFLTPPLKCINYLMD